MFPIALLFVIMKRTGQEHLFLWFKKRVGPVVASILFSVIAFELFLMSLLTTRDLTYWANITYLPKTPNLVIVAAFAIVSFYSAHSGLRSTAIVNGILLPFVILFGWFVALSNIPNKDYRLLFPILQDGPAPIYRGMLYSFAGSMTIFLILLMKHRIHSKTKLWHLLVTGIVMLNLTISPLTGAIAEFGPAEAARQRFPAYEEWRLITFGHFLEHVDFLSIYQWLVGGFMRVSLAMMLIPEIFHLPKGKIRSGLLAILYALLTACTQIHVSDMKFMEILRDFYFPYSVILFTSLTFVFLFSTIIKRKGTPTP